MMKRNSIFVLLLLLMVYSCNQRESTIVVKGEIERAANSYIYFQELTVKGDGLKDSMKLGNSGSFKFKRTTVYPTFYNLRIGNGKPITILAMPKQKITISGHGDSILYNSKIKGSEETRLVQLLALRLDITQKRLDSLNRVYQQFMDNRNIVNIKSLLEMTYQRFIDEQRDFNISFIKQYPTSYASLMALYQQIDSKNFILYKEDDFKYFAKIDSSLYKQYPSAPYVLSLHANVIQMREQQNKIKLQRMISEMGAKAQEIALPSPKGDTIRLSSIKGKYVLVDFWASWCSPCREENPNLVKLYKKYKSKGFEIFQVSLDKTKESWVKAIKDDGLTWLHVSDLKYWDSPIAKVYNVESIPSSFLLDKDGTIMSKNLRGEALEQRLASLLGE